MNKPTLNELIEQSKQNDPKSFRIIVVNVHTPSPEALQILGKAMGEMEARGVSLKWGTQRQVVELAETP